MSASVPRLLVAAPASGSGKTTVVCGLLRVFSDAGLAPVALKCGPDYIDPQFHRRVSGVPGGNLDTFFTDGPTCASLLARAARGAGMAVLEGAMGLYDGVVGGGTRASAYDVARATATPVVLVVDARGASLTLAAIVCGLARFRADANVAGVILNGCSPALLSRLRGELEEACGVRVLGCLPRDERFSLDSRHLGLVGADEGVDVRERIGCVAQALRENVDVEELVRIARSAPELDAEPYASPRVAEGPVRVAVARDEAFAFYYDENLRMLEDMGCELAWFSPLRDECLPAGARGLYLGGGYPELHGPELAGNAALRGQVAAFARAAAAGGAPVLAECGGFMYLQRGVADETGRVWPMAGALSGVARSAGRLVHFGYIMLESRVGSLLGPAGTRVPAHEFHYWHSDVEGAACVAEKPSGVRWECVHARGNLLAGYPHVYFPAHPQLARAFVRAAAQARPAGGAR